MRFLFSSRIPSTTLHRQRGVAVITALLLATLAITIVASLFWQQQVQVRSIENQRLQLQTQWILRGALDWASLILREDGKQSSVDYLSEPWATPLAETRLDQYVDDGSTDQEASAAVLSGYIVDAQSRYNLSNLVNGKIIDPVALNTFSRLLSALHLDAALAQSIAQTLSSQQAGTAVLPLKNIEDLLAVPGVTPALVNALNEFVVILPQATPINVNTAPLEVLAARLDTLSRAQVSSMIAERTQHYYTNLVDFQTRINAVKPTVIAAGAFSVGSNYFLVKGKVQMGRAALASWSLIQRSGSGEGTTTKLLWSRESPTS